MKNQNVQTATTITTALIYGINQMGNPGTSTLNVISNKTK